MKAKEPFETKILEAPGKVRKPTLEELRLLAAYCGLVSDAAEGDPGEEGEAEILPVRGKVWNLLGLRNLPPFEQLGEIAAYCPACGHGFAWHDAAVALQGELYCETCRPWHR